MNENEIMMNEEVNEVTETVEEQSSSNGFWKGAFAGGALSVMAILGYKYLKAKRRNKKSAAMDLKTEDTEPIDVNNVREVEDEEE